MKNGICLLAFIPQRLKPKDSSEMVSQILFGETFTILQNEDKWSYVENDFDGYQGWISQNSFSLISEEEKTKIQNTPNWLNTDPLLTVRVDSNPLLLPAGSLCFGIESSFQILNTTYTLETFIHRKKSELLTDTIISTALNLINTPYLWGGRSSFGIDCSGFVQLCFRAAGIQLHRDAGQQAEQGQTICIQEALSNDIAFFSNQAGKIIHVGILLDKKNIIHASGKVRKDLLDEKGIFNRESETYTHSLCLIKRMV